MSATTPAPLLEVHDLTVHYALPGRSRFLGGGKLRVHAVDGVSFDLGEGETLGIVGETGCGKSSLGRAVLQLVRPTAGSVRWRNRDLCTLPEGELREVRRELQIIFQDPLSSLNPRMTVGEIVAEPLRLHQPGMPAEERQRAVAEMFTRVGLRPDMTSRYPSEFSGGQAQRVSIARAMILAPRLIVCDEPVSALDVSIQAQVCNLLRDLQRETGISMIFISHDLAIVRYMCQRVLVMYLGQVMELADRDALFDRPLHPYSRALISAVPRADPQHLVAEIPVLDGEMPSPIDPPGGCPFHSRCPQAIPRCISTRPPLEDTGDGRKVACHRWREPPGSVPQMTRQP
ncbi:MAG: ATP-binding cassette domain-containing protein [Gammaproteobacteria bacterium]|nr:ATP-binding cassette domain-containing protein [Gammaproteobacteria bacterium]